MTRHRMKPIANPLVPIEEEFDPERALWVPGRKKIFLPAPRESFPWDMGLSLDFNEIYRHLLTECVPGRHNFLGADRSQGTPNLTVGTWGNLRRSDTPMWRPHPAQIRFITGNR